MGEGAEHWLKIAAAQVNAGDLAAAWNSYVAAVQAEPGNAQAWLGLGMTALLQRQWALIGQVADRRHNLAGDGFAYFHDVLTVIASYGLYPLIEELGRHLAPESPYVPSQLYYAGCARLLAGDEDGAFALFRQLKPLLAARRADLPIGSEDRFNVAYRQATLIEDGDYPDSLDADHLASIARGLPALTEVERWHPQAEAGFVLLAACDGRYLDRFGVDFLRSADQMGTGMAVHLHVVEPSAAGMERIAELAARCRNGVTLTSEAANPWRSGAYYASSRFLVAAEIMAAHGGKPVMITDIDIRFLRPPAELAAAARPYGFASFVHDGAGPCSRLPAVWTWFQGEDGAAMLGALRRTLLSKLDIPWPHNWMLDQAALMTARRWLRRCNPDAAVAEMNTVTGQIFAHYLECRGDEDDKAALIREAGQGLSGV